MAEFDKNMDFPELDAYFSKTSEAADDRIALLELLKRGAVAYRGTEELRKKCLNARELLPKEYRYLEFAGLQKLIEKCKIFDLKNYSRELINVSSSACAIIRFFNLLLLLRLYLFFV